MKKDWEIKKLGELGNIFSGNSINEKEKKSYMDLSKKGLFYVATKDISSDSEIEYKNGILIPDECLSKFKIAHKDSVLICAEGGSAGKKLAYNSEYDICFVNKLFAFEANNSIFSKFVFYYYQSSDFVKHFKNRLAGLIGGVSLQKFKEIPCPVPPLEEQKRIVKILDEKFAQLETIKANSQTNLQNAKDLFQSQLAKAFSNTTWEKAKLEDIALDFSRGKSKHRPRNDKCLFGGDYPFIQTGDIRNADKYVTDYSETYNETGLAQSKLWPAGTLCITIAANIAETAILSFPCCFPDSVIGFIPNEKLTTVDFVYYLIQFFKSELQNLSKGAAQDNLNLAKFENMNFPLPPLLEQKRIVKELDTLSEKVRQLQEIYSKQIANCAELKQSLLQKAFEGEL